ncbi:uncharacterized protein LOC118276710 isoform X3 [Spodoptera frugiperda]|uniref:Uncharacterized protein LOC118276710 isoform X3 n=1 Tax=Spodoptera frugiperda TaxID=7108 RepID=A0A9R0DYY5_SPOFR|nr:uncharacterized protein LOC118276710 isoform X3 [Spodoptera frugiperda]
MMITILGFPPKTKYQDVKILIKQECNISDFILDNLVNDSTAVGTKKVRIGLTDNAEGYKVMKCLDGYRMPGNYVLKAMPVGKTATNLPTQGAFDTHMSYQDHPRNDYSAAPRNDYMGQSNSFNNQPHGSGMHSTAAHVARPTHGQGGHSGQMEINRPSPWATGNNSTQWTAGPSMASQVPQNTFGGFNSPQASITSPFGQQHHQNPVHSRPDMRPGFNQTRTHTEQTYGGYPPKTNVPEVQPRQETRHALRSIETVDTNTASRAPIHARYPPSQPYQQEKSVTIMKDNFQGPTPYNISNPGAQAGSGGQQYPTTAPSSSPWQSQEYEKRHGFSPRRETIAHGGRSVERRPSPPARRISPPGRRVSPHARKFSPAGKRPSPDRHVLTHHTASHSHHPGRRDSPHKRPSPMRRLVSPPRRTSPGRRPSPGRRDSPQRMSRYSPERHHSDKLDKFAQDKLKQVRPAYEPSSHASNQAMYSGGYRSDVRDSVQYMQGVRQGPRISPWQRDEPAALKKPDDDRRDLTRMQMGRDRMPDAVVDPKHGITPQRKSRSPVRRERSPLRDRYKRHSPSPRSSHSPRRSWALEKRRSPEIRDAPPPPSWPGQKGREAESFSRTPRTFPEREQDEGPKHVPVWQRPFGKDEDPRDRRPDNNDRRPFIEDKVRPTKEVPVREPVPHPSHSERFVQREPKFTPRDDYEADRRDAYRRREPSVERKPHPQREDYEQVRRPREHEERMHPDEYHRRREPSPRRDSRKDDAANPIIDKDFEDIYKRALQFKKKAEELRRLGSKKRDDYVEDEARSYHSEREREDRSQRYEDRHRYREEELLRHREREERPRDDRPRDDRPRDDRPRDDRPRDDRPRDDRSRDDRPRDDRPRDDRSRDDGPRDDRQRDDRPRDDRPRHDPRPDDMRRPEFRPREEYSKQPEREQDRRFTVNPAIRVKRDKAIEEICKKLLDKHPQYQPAKEEYRARIMEELQLAIARIVFDMFGDSDVAFIEIIIKFQAKYSYKDEEKILQDVMSSLPSHYRASKRQAPEPAEVPAKVARRSASPSIKTEKRPVLSPKKQRPLQTILRRKPEQLAKIEQKPSANEPRVTKVEVKKEEEKKPAPAPAPVEPPLQGGHYELNDRMTKMVETELRDIMIKVWQELPDNPMDEAEALVVDKLRNAAGDHLRNVLGLNVTKRLLNVHNPLYVKVQFSGKPEKQQLGDFLKKYNFIAFKRIEKTVNMFAAQVKSITDFDRICSEKDVRCGEVKVTVNPIYKFTKCPSNLVTSFCDADDNTSDENAEINEKDDKSGAKTNKEKPAESVKSDPSKEKLNKDENVTKVEATVIKTDANLASSKPVANKDDSKPAVKKADTDKPAANKVTNEKPAINKVANEKPAANKADEKPAEQPVTKVPVENKPSVNITKVANKPVVANKPAEKKQVVENKNVKAVPVKNVAKPVARNEIKKPNSNVNNIAKKPTPNTNNSGKKPISTPVKTATKFANKKESKVESDNDELDDQDILALMSEGIVLDECSGSDDE